MLELSLEVYRVRLEGVRPLICHNCQLADPTNEFVQKMREISAIKSKTDEHRRQLADLEWVGGWYLNEKRQPHLPDHVLEGMIASAARRLKLGRAVKSAVEVLDSPTIEHDGPKGATVDDLYGKPKYRHFCSAKVKSSRIMRTRPILPVWAAEFDVQVDIEAVKPRDLKEVLVGAGRFDGLCDFRPKFGRFQVTKFEKVG